MFPEIFCISPSMASKRDDLPQPTCPTIIVSWPVREEDINKLLINHMLTEKYLFCTFYVILYLEGFGYQCWTMLEDLQVSKWKIHLWSMPRWRETRNRKPALELTFFVFNIRDIRPAFMTLSTGIELAFANHRSLTDFVKACILMCTDLWTQISTTTRKLWKTPEEKEVAVSGFSSFVMCKMGTLNKWNYYDTIKLYIGSWFALCRALNVTLDTLQHIQQLRGPNYKQICRTFHRN